jgi:hypothetical protein
MGQADGKQQHMRQALWKQSERASLTGSRKERKANLREESVFCGVCIWQWIISERCLSVSELYAVTQEDAVFFFFFHK